MVLRTFLAFDVETTGLVDASIVTGAVVRFENGYVTSEHEFLARPIREIEESATKIHGISDEYALENGKPHADVVSLLVSYLQYSWDSGIPVLIYNAPFDLGVLQSDCGIYPQNLKMSIGKVIDPLGIERMLRKEARNNKLGQVAKRYGIETENLHNAASDAKTAGLVWLAQLDANPYLTHITNEVQNQWAQKWNAKYYTGWPISVKTEKTISEMEISPAISVSKDISSQTENSLSTVQSAGDCSTMEPPF